MNPQTPPSVRKQIEKLLDAYTLRERQTREGYGVPLSQTADAIMSLVEEIEIKAQLKLIDKLRYVAPELYAEYLDSKEYDLNQDLSERQRLATAVGKGE
jgi:hypothetical protein